MNRTFMYYLIAGIIVFSGCISVPQSPSARFYEINPMADKEIKPIDLSLDLFVGVREMKVLSFLNRPQIVTQEKNHQLKFAQFDRWAEPLNEAMTRVIKENVAMMLPQARIISYPSDLPLSLAFRVEMEMTRFEIDLSSELLLIVQWSVLDVKFPRNSIIQRSELRVPLKSNDYAGAVDALSTACATLSQQIAHGISQIVKRPNP